MAQVLTLTRQDGTTEDVNIGSPYLAVLFERTFQREPSGSQDAGWMAFVDRQNNRPPENEAEMDEWLMQFVAIDIGDYKPPDPTAATANGSPLSDESSPD